MADNFEDYWPDDLTTVADPEPVTFLKKQADALQGKTTVVRAEVTSNTVEGTVYYSLYLKASHLGDYGFKILYLAYPIFRDVSNPYPLTVQHSFDGEVIEIANFDAFKEWLKPTLSSPQVKAVIENLKRQNRVVL